MSKHLSRGSLLANLDVYNPVDKVVDNSHWRQKRCGQWWIAAITAEEAACFARRHPPVYPHVGEWCKSPRLPFAISSGTLADATYRPPWFFPVTKCCSDAILS
jgi:hypothetical protein